MKLHNTISILFTTLLLCGSAFAAKPSPVDVVNTPDVNVVNAISWDDVQPKSQSTSGPPSGSFLTLS
jgi:hypothetical protein